MATINITSILFLDWIQAALIVAWVAGGFVLFAHEQFINIKNPLKLILASVVCGPITMFLCVALFLCLFIMWVYKALNKFCEWIKK